MKKVNSTGIKIKSSLLFFALSVFVLMNNTAWAQCGNINAVSKNNLILYYPFDGNNGFDFSGNGLNATLNGSSATTGRNGVANTGIAFSGSSGTSTPSNALMNTNTQVTASVWVKSSSIASNMRLFDRNPSGNTFLFDLYLSKPRFICAGVNLHSTTTLLNNTWYHLAATYDGATMKIYVNGALASSVANTASIGANSANMQIGRDQFGGSNFQGSMDDARYYTRALSAAEIGYLYAEPEITTHPANQAYCTLGGNFSLTTTAAGTNLSYQWLKNGVAVTNDAVISGATTNTLSFTNPNATHAGNYQMVAINSVTCVADTSNPAAFTATTNIDVSNNGLVFYYPFNNANLNDLSGNNNTLTSSGSYGAATGYDGTALNATQIPSGQLSPHTGHTTLMNITTQLTLSAWINPLSTADQRIYDKTPFGNGNNFLFDINQNRIRFLCANVSLLSNTLITANTWTHVSAVYDGVQMKIYINGVLDATVANTTSCVSNGLPLIIGRDQSGTPGSNAFTGKLDELRMYRRALSASEAAMLPSLSSITAQPNATSTFCVGVPFSISINAPSANVTYQWQKNGADISGANSGTLNLQGNAGDAANYQCRLNVGCSSWLSDTSVATIVTGGGSITTQPQSITVCEGGSNLALNVTATGASAYQWYHNGNVIPLMTNSSFATNSAQASDAGEYYCMVTTGCGNISSDTVDVTINAATAITQQPTAVSACVGGAATVSVTATGTNIGYQWRLDNQPINGATAASYSIASAGATDMGNYQVVITGTCGQVSSAAALMSVNDVPDITVQLSGSTIFCQGSVASLGPLSTDGGDITYQWYKDGAPISGAINNGVVISSNATSADAGSYTMIASNGCGADTAGPCVASVVQTQTPTLTASGNTLTATGYDAGAILTWTFNGNILSGVTSNTYVATQSGDYEVSAVYSGCEKLSGVVTVNITGIHDLQKSVAVQLYPNPANDFVVITCDHQIETAEVYNVVGKKVIFVKGQITKLNTAALAQGVYTLQLKTTAGNTATKKFMKQ